jgi:hypothetical protein
VATAIPAISKDLGAVHGLRRVFLGNHRELEEKLSIVNDPAKWLPIWSIDGNQLQPYLDDLDRYFFNYLASAFSLSASIFDIKKRLRGVVQFPDYTAKNPYERSELAAFVLQLRHVVQHDRVTVAQGKLSFSRSESGSPLEGGPNFVIGLVQLKTLDYDKPDPPEYVQSLTEDLPLSTVVDGFTPELLAFADWFMTQLKAGRA